ncbi:Kinesin motor domain [Trypanosoma vivax]|uniref:Putative kinesin n=1 Tax=Trypanosoma vivax (strain Y486) TaxID=1055687 RepID=G0U3T5_TRYVY|nr:putative kinesin [Trypanosoma vivax]KAH8613986.1 Kinesin motor domain [Trypanosoma vivax]CCC50944.1 putative kinesin [Trypanosoma vivax Y486]
MEGGQKVSVAVRVRPILREGGSAAHALEKFELQAVHRTGDTTLKVELQRPGEPTRSSSFTFDHIFDQESTQLDVYEEAVAELVDATLAGANTTMLTYGQTGSGKTFTVLGDVKPNPLEDDLLTHNSGMFLRVLSDLMEYKKRMSGKGFHVVIGLSCVEIYNESIRDLFGGTPGTPPPTIKAMMIGDDVLLPQLIIKELTTLQNVFSEIQLAISRRLIRPTEANAQSSRSHCLFLIDVLQQADTAPPPPLSILETKKGGKEKETKRVTCDGSVPGELPFDGTAYRIPGQQELVFGSKILVGDLAGSEKLAKSGVTGEGLAEATAINSSLTALGNVVHSLHEGGFVCYRTSNLTRLLKPTFSHPNSRVLLLTQVSPTQLTFDETLSTLHFCNKVKAMKVTTTTSGDSGNKLQFEYVESGKTFDSVLADLHIFATESDAQCAFIRRTCLQNGGLYYATAEKASAKFVPKERITFLEGIGAVRIATQEREAVQKRRQKEEEDWETSVNTKVREEAQKMASEYSTLLEEAKESLKKENDTYANISFHDLNAETVARKSGLQTEEETEFASLMAQFMRGYIKLCKKCIEDGVALEEKISQELNTHQRTAIEVPEIAQDNLNYANACWSHCVGKKFLSGYLEVRELQLHLWSFQKGLVELKAWREANAEALA